MKKLEQIASLFDDEAVIFLSVRDFTEIKDELSALNKTMDDNSDWQQKGANYGVFKQAKEKALELGFITVYINGKTLYFNTGDNLMKMLKIE